MNEGVWSFPKYQTFLAIQQVYEDVGLFIGVQETLTGDNAAPEPIDTEVVTAGYLSTLGVKPMLGHAFSTEETDKTGARPLVLLGYGLWTRRFGSDPNVLGRAISINDVHTVVGVIPPGFRGLTGRARPGCRWQPSAGVADRAAMALVLSGRAQKDGRAGRCCTRECGGSRRATRHRDRPPRGRPDRERIGEVARCVTCGRRRPPRVPDVVWRRGVRAAHRMVSPNDRRAMRDSGGGRRRLVPRIASRLRC